MDVMENSLDGNQGIRGKIKDVQRFKDAISLFILIHRNEEVRKTIKWTGKILKYLTHIEWSCSVVPVRKQVGKGDGGSSKEVF